MSKIRDHWIDYIKKTGMRLLFSGGTASSWFEDRIDDKKIRKLINSLEEKELHLVLFGKLFHISSNKTQSFFNENLKRLTRTLAHKTDDIFLQTRQCGKGKIKWQQTITGRLSGRFDASTFSVRQLNKSYDTAENRLLKLYLSNIAEAVYQLKTFLGSKRISSNILEIGRVCKKTLSSRVLGESAGRG